MDWPAFLPLFLTASVEWVEAFTIVLAVSLTIGWRASLGAAAAGLGTLVLLTAVTGGAIGLGLNLHAIQLVIGVFLLLFGVRWLAKAIARQAVLKALHEEACEIRARISRGNWLAAGHRLQRNAAGERRHEAARRNAGYPISPASP